MGGRGGNAAASALGKHQLCYQTTKEVWYFKLSQCVAPRGRVEFSLSQKPVFGGVWAAGSGCALSDAHGGCVAAGVKLTSVL